MTGGGVAELVDEIFSAVPNAGELGISWQIFGSDGQETADYSRGVLERFTRRSDNVTKPITMCKFIANPRTISFMDSPHCAFHFEGFVAINEKGEVKPHPPWNIIPPLTEKIVINHYHCKSWEEYQLKRQRGRAAYAINDIHTREQFDRHDRNEVFDDGILHYRDARAKTYQPPDKSRADERLLNALMENLSPTLIPSTPPQFFAGKMETFLTCRAVAAYLKARLPDNTLPKFFEEAAIKAMLKTTGGMSFADARLLISELPKILPLKYPAVKDLRGMVLQIIPQMMDVMHLNGMWKDYAELHYINELLKVEE